MVYQTGIRTLRESKLKIIQAIKRFLVLLGLTSFALSANTQELKYDVIKNGKTIGKIIVSRIKNDSSTQMKLYSQVTASLFVKVQVNSWEESQFKNGMLTFSSVIREVNGRKQINRQIKWNKYAYHLYEDGQKTTIQSVPISFNIVKLYFEEPVNRTTVFSENQKSWLEIVKTKDHQYKLKLPDGNYNEFFYQDGICTKVKVHSTFFNAIFQLSK